MTGQASVTVSTLPLAVHDLRLKPDTAERDLHLFDALNSRATPSVRLTTTLAAGFEPASDEADGGFHRLSIVDRQAALFRLATAHGSWPAWFTAGCARCGQLIDVRAHAGEFACRAPAHDFPTVEIELGGERRRFMLPNGAHEEMLALPDGRERVTAACAIDKPLALEDAGLWCDAFDAAVERAAERQPLALPMPCPHCGDDTEFWFDPYDWIARHAGRSLRDVHLIARQYAWSERAILDMPAARRDAYLALIRGNA